MDYNQKVSGPKNIYALDALRNIALMARQPLTVSASNFMPDMLQAMASLYPQKAAYVGREGLEALIQKAMGGAKRQRFATVRGVVLVSVLMLAFGHGCAIDPLYPWIAKTFKDDTLTDPEARAKRLEKNALTWPIPSPILLPSWCLAFPLGAPSTSLALRSAGLGRRSARWMSLWSAATRRRMVRKAATSHRTPHLVG